MRLTLAEAAAGLGAPAPKGAAETLATGACIDSRAVKPGDLFFCLPGAHADGHDFAPQAAQGGAAAIVASRPLPDVSIPVLAVPDVALALGDLARAWRKKLSTKVVAVTGTAGKTTLKDALASILSKAGKTAATQGNLNNQLGLPLTLLSADGDERFLVAEAGISHAGDMDYLGGICLPDAAVILNAGQGHTEGLGARGVAWNKCRLLQHLAPSGFGLINGECPDLVAEAERSGKKTTLFGKNPGTCAYIATAQDGGVHSFKLDGWPCSFKTPLDMEFGWEPALAAAAAAYALGASYAQMEAGFADLKLPRQRFNASQAGNLRIIDDSYNANPLSMRASLKAAAKIAAQEGRPFVAVLGEMRELGADAKAAHLELGGLLKSLQPLRVFWHGAWLNEIRSCIPAEAFADASGFADRWRAARLPENALVIFKGSRANRLEGCIAALKKAIGVQEAEGVL